MPATEVLATSDQVERGGFPDGGIVVASCARCDDHRVLTKYEESGMADADARP
jgi:hypothetical protein